MPESIRVAVDTTPPATPSFRGGEVEQANPDA